MPLKMMFMYLQVMIDESISEAFMYTQNVLQGNTTTQVNAPFVFEQTTTITNVESCASMVQSTSSDQDQIPNAQGSTIQPDCNEVSSNDEVELHSNDFNPSSSEAQADESV